MPAGQQFVGGEGLQAIQAGAQLLGQLYRPVRQCGLQLLVRLHGGGLAQGVAAAQVGLDIARRLVLELLGQAQIALHQLVGAFEGAL